MVLEIPVSAQPPCIIEDKKNQHRNASKYLGTIGERKLANGYLGIAYC